MADRPPTPTPTPERAGSPRQVLTVPNALSMVRLAGIPIFLWLILGPQADAWAIVVLGVAGITDWFDGFLARRLGQESELGKILDPVADRAYILAVLFGLAMREIIPWWLAAVIPLRDLLMLGLLLVLRRGGFGPLPVHFLGKAATFCLMYAFGALFLGTYTEVFTILGWALVTWGTALYWWAGLLYGLQARRLLAGVGGPDGGDPAR